MLPALAIAAVAAPVIGGIMGNIAASGDRAAAADASRRAYEEAIGLGLPPDTAKALIMQEFKKAGTYTPEMEQEINIGISQVAGIKEDGSLRDAQTNALQALQQRGKGLGAEDRASLNQVRSEMARDAEAKRQQIIQGFQQRGMGGSGGEIAAQLMQAQAGANQASMEGDRLAGDSSARALESIRSAGALGGQIRQQDFGVAQAKASAADEFQRFNVQNQVAREQRNVANRNQGSQYNLSEGQRIQDANTQQANSELLRQQDAKERYWQNEKDRVTLRSNAASGQATQLGNAANQTANMWAGVGAGVGAGAGAAANYMGKQPAGGTEDPNAQRNARLDIDDERMKKFGRTT